MKTSRFTTERSGPAPCCSAQVLPRSVVAMMKPTRVPLLETAQPWSASMNTTSWSGKPAPFA